MSMWAPGYGDWTSEARLRLVLILFNQEDQVTRDRIPVIMKLFTALTLAVASASLVDAK
jgi:hypothetical protein